MKETSLTTRLVWTLVHVLILGLAFWWFFGSGVETVSGWVGKSWTAGDFGRRALLFVCGSFFLVRMLLGSFVLMTRKVGWNEMGAVVGAIALYQLGFAFLGGRETAPLALFDVLAFSLFFLGMFFSAYSELQRMWFKNEPENRGKIFMRGLFSLSRHVNYFGETLWGLGWALLTRNVWSGVIVAAEVMAFIFIFIPELSRYLAQKYGGQYQEYCRRTPSKFIPFIY